MATSPRDRSRGAFHHADMILRRISNQPRRGMALLMVLLLLSLTLGLSYAAMRSQSTAGMIQRNSDRRASARQAAITGLTMALKKMHRSDWAGVNTSLSGSPNASESFLATYTVGDPRLSASDPDQPYRVTLLSTGYAADPNQPASIAMYRVRAIVRLVPRKLALQPSDWAAMQGYTLYQTGAEDTELDIPCRFTGPARLQKTLRIARHYPNDAGARSRYIADLNSMRLAGLPDCRPFNGPVYLPISWQEANYLALLTPGLGVTVINTPAQPAAADWVKPTSPTSYRIYPGGPVYTVQAVPDTLQATTLQGDPQVNPLGLYYRDGAITINNNVTIRGSLFCRDNIQIAGANVLLQPVALPPLAGTTTPVRLAAASSQNTTVKATGGGSVTGLVAVFDTFQIDHGADNMAFAIAGQLVTRKLYIKERDSWAYLNWDLYYSWFRYQLLWPNSVKYFPVWMNSYGRNPTPHLTFAPESTATTYHWAQSYDPIFVPDPTDGGLRWDLLHWAENL